VSIISADLAVLPDTDAQGALAVAEQIRRKVESQVVVRGNDTQQAVMVSIGCATTLPRHGGCLERTRPAGRRRSTALGGEGPGRNRVSSAPCGESSAAQPVSGARRG
jgi:hypothetical protein